MPPMSPPGRCALTLIPGDPGPHLFTLTAPDRPKAPARRVPSCWPPHFAVAPVTDCSVLDTWRPLLRTDCSALHILRPALATDLTRCPTLHAQHCSRIAPLTTLCARAGHGSLRATDDSVVSTWNSAPPADCSAHDTWCSSPDLDCSNSGVLPLYHSRIAPLLVLGVP